MMRENKNFEVQIKCRFCHKLKTIYLNIHPEQGQIKYNDYVCASCGLSQKISLEKKENHTQYIIKKLRQENINEIKNKMAIRNKHEGLDQEYVTYKDIDDGAIGDTLIVTIGNEGELNTAGQYGDRWLIVVLWQIEKEKFEKKINLSKKNENQVIELHGNDTTNWVGKNIKLVVSSCDVGKSGKMIEVSDKKV